ncbi:MAG: VOC family protein [Paracoccaceae bacterium]
MARAFYTEVFDAKPSGSKAAGLIAIGTDRYRLVVRKLETPALCARVADVDVCCARIATRGGRILAPPHLTADGRREGRVMDPFGQSWIVSAG